MLLDDPSDKGFWAVTRHADLVEVTKRHENFLSGEGIVMESIPQELLDAGQGFIAMDPPRHTKIRRLLSSAFTPKQIARINDQIAANARRIVDDLAPKGEADFVPDCAALVPMHNICDMLGIDPADRAKLSHESQFAGAWSDPELMKDQEPLGRLFEAMGYLGELASKNIEQRRAQPGDDLLTSLVQAEVDGERLTDDEIISFFGLLTIAGNDTTRQSTSHAMKALTDFPDQRAWLMEDLDARLPGAVEEMVRWATPIMTFRRTRHGTANSTASRSARATRWSCSTPRPTGIPTSSTPRSASTCRATRTRTCPSAAAASITVWATSSPAPSCARSGASCSRGFRTSRYRASRPTPTAPFSTG
jgi:cytochrome P450